MKKILSLSKLENFILYSQEKNIFPIVEVDNVEDLESILKIPNKEF
jgi:indole-3-glycerol phosphate synthase